jgi:tetratricopeptide (TPR) repeat protein
MREMTRAIAGIAAAALVTIAAGAAWAGDRAAAEQSFARAEQAAKDLAFAEALSAYRAAIAADPSAPFARVARARADDLEAHAEGGFRPLAQLEAVRRDPRSLGDRESLFAFAREVEAFPPGRVRAEARMLVAEKWQKLGDPLAAIAALERTAGDASADKLTRALALSQLWTLRRQRGEIREALAAVERDPDVSPALTLEVRRVARRERMRVAAIAVLSVLAAIGAASIAWLAKKARDVRDVPARVVRPAAVAFALYLGGAGALLVHFHGGGDGRPFVWFGLGVLALDVIARAFVRASGARRLPVRAAWAAACVAGVAAAAFLAVERTDVSFLEGIGL